MVYAAPLDDMLFAMKLAAGEGVFGAGGLYADLGDGLLEATLNEADKFAREQLLPLDRTGDRAGSRFENGAVTTPPGWREAYAQFVAGGWTRLAADAAFDGLGLPTLLNVACTEIWNAANCAFAICPLLAHGAVRALEEHAPASIKETYLPRLVSGEWTATMNLTEPQAGSDLSLTRTRAEPAADGGYRLFGQKIFITYGEHDLTSNILHLVLAKLPGEKAISLFLAPKFLPDGTGAFSRRNDLRCAGIEHKLGIKGSPTCTMVYGDGEGATAYLLGQPNKGLAAMFTMMNEARLAVGVQGVGLAERATQMAIGYARERVQGGGPIIAHPDVARMALTMQALTAAARAIGYETAVAIDRGRRLGDAVAQERAGLLTPLAKAFGSDIANEVASLGVQIFGGMGYIEETGAAQLFRDARIAAIYEGTNGIQANDLVQRKLRHAGGGAMRREIEAMRRDAKGDALSEAVDALAAATDFLLDCEPHLAQAGATPYLRLFALARGGALLAKAARDGEAKRSALAEFFARNLAVAAPGLARAVIEGGASAAQFSG
jgi:acyl-CoA dehydrogenase